MIQLPAASLEKCCISFCATSNCLEWSQGSGREGSFDTEGNGWEGGFDTEGDSLEGGSGGGIIYLQVQNDFRTDVPQNV